MGDIIGVTFDNQAVTPKNDGRLYRKILADGIITGCAITKSGANLTIAAGGLMICGRYMELASAVTLAIDGETSGYARVKVVLDMTKTATEEAFEQAYFEVDYSATTSFTALTQEDINAAGSTYECEICVVSLDAGGIAAVESQIDLAKKSLYFTGALSSDWVGGAAPYTQEVSISGLLDDDNPHVTPIYSSNNSTALLEQATWSKIGKVIASENKLTFTCFATKPTQAIDFLVEVNR